MSMSFLETLAQQGVINRYQIDDIIEKAEEFNGDIDDALASLAIDDTLVRHAKSEYYGLPEMELTAANVSSVALQYIPEDSARHYKSVAFGIDPDGTVLVGMVDPDNGQARTAIQFIFSKKNTPYTIVVISLSDFKRVIENSATFGPGLAASEEGASEETSFKSDDTEIQTLEQALKKVGDKEGGTTIVDDSPIAKTVEIFLRNAIDGGASDIHIEHTHDSVKVRFRVDGELHTSYTLPKSVRNTIVARIKILADLKLDEKRKPQDGRFPAKVDGRTIDFRVSTLPTFFGEKVVIRILDPEKGVTQLEHTGMNKGHLDIVRRAIARPYGIILMTGPTGSGKTSTLYTMLREIDLEHRNVVSLEDPIEYTIDGLNQSQVQPEIGYTFANGLRSILRQDPDVIYVGEIRDKETAQLAIQAALTGHLVLSTLHTNTAAGAIPRLIDMGVDPYLIAPTLILSMAQRLSKRICEGGGKQVPLEGGMKGLIDHQFEDLPAEFRAQVPLTDYVYEAVEVPGYPGGTHGRIGVFEMLEIDIDIQNIILKEGSEQSIYEYTRKQGLLTIKEDAILKSMQGLIPWSEINKL